jgi:hypothetical protein
MTPSPSLNTRNYTTPPRPAVCDDDQIHFRDRRVPVYPWNHVIADFYAERWSLVDPPLIIAHTVVLGRLANSLSYYDTADFPDHDLAIDAWLNPIVAEYYATITVSMHSGPSLYIPRLVCPLVVDEPLTWVGSLAVGPEPWHSINLTLRVVE